MLHIFFRFFDDAEFIESSAPFWKKKKLQRNQLATQPMDDSKVLVGSADQWSRARLHET